MYQYLHIVWSGDPENLRVDYKAWPGSRHLHIVLITDLKTIWFRIYGDRYLMLSELMLFAGHISMVTNARDYKLKAICYYYYVIKNVWTQRDYIKQQKTIC